MHSWGNRLVLLGSFIPHGQLPVESESLNFRNDLMGHPAWSVQSWTLSPRLLLKCCISMPNRTWMLYVKGLFIFFLTLMGYFEI